MAWDLNSTNQYVQFTMSAALKAATGGPFTFGAVINLDSTTDGALIHFLDGTTGRHFMEIFGTYNFGTSAAAKAGPSGVTGAWYHVIMTKATGNVVPEYTVTPLATGVPVSGSCSGGNLGNGAAPGAAGVIQVGRFAVSATELVDGKVAATWGHASYMNQATREALTTFALVVTACQVGGLGWAVHYDTLSTLVDATGLGGNEIGRFGTTPFTLVTDPAGAFFGGTGATATPATVAGVGAVPTPTVSAGATVAASTVAGVGSIPAPTVSAGVTVAATAVLGVGTVPTPTVSAGATLAATAVTGVGTVPAPTVAAGATVAPATVTGVGTVPSPAVAAGGGATAAPATVAGVGSVPAPAVTVTVSVAVTTVTGVGTVPAPAVTATSGATVAPATVTGVGRVPSPVVSAGGVAPTPVLTHVKDPTPLAFTVAAPVRHVRVAPLVHTGGG